MTVLFGLFGDIAVDQKRFNFKMPEFSQMDDATLAAVLNFVIFDLAKAQSEMHPLEPDDIARERAHPLDGQGVREHRSQVLADLGSPKRDGAPLQ
jgi:hypothetical protein